MCIRVHNYLLTPCLESTKRFCPRPLKIKTFLQVVHMINTLTYSDPAFFQPVLGQSEASCWPLLLLLLLFFLLFSSSSVPPLATWLCCAPPTGGRAPPLFPTLRETLNYSKPERWDRGFVSHPPQNSYFRLEFRHRRLWEFERKWEESNNKKKKHKESRRLSSASFPSHLLLTSPKDARLSHPEYLSSGRFFTPPVREKRFLFSACLREFQLHFWPAGRNPEETPRAGRTL